MADLLSLAFAHHKTPEPRNPDLTIYAWDATHTGDMIPPWDEPEFDKNARLDPSFFGVYVSGEESLNFYNPETRTAYFWTHESNRLPDWVFGAPFRTILHWFFTESDIHLIHGAVVGHSGKSALLTARSGSGKSTTALSCLISGMDYLADDYVAITSHDTMAHSLYQSAKITRDGVSKFPEFADIIYNKDFGEREKAVLFLQDAFPNQVKTIAPLSIILIPRITGGETKLVPASKIEALVAIAPTTLLQLPLAETNKIGAFKELIQKVPCYYLELGPDIRNIPEVIKGFLSENII